MNWLKSENSLSFLLFSVRSRRLLWLVLICNKLLQNYTISGALCSVLFKFGKSCCNLGKPTVSIPCAAFKLKNKPKKPPQFFSRYVTVESLFVTMKDASTCVCALPLNVSVFHTTHAWLKADMHIVIFHTLTLVTQIEKLFRFYVPYSRDLNLSSCHMA